MRDPAAPLDGLRQQLRAFAREREWERFHTPKNLAMALAGEAAEVLELFQWLTPEESGSLSRAQRAALADEIGDVLIYLVMLADHTGLDPLECARAKVLKNQAKYPAHLARGRADRPLPDPDAGGEG